MITAIVTWILFSTSLCLAGSNSDPLNQHSVLKSYPKNENDMELLKSLGKKYMLDFWSEPNRMLRPVVFSVSPKVRQSVMNYLKHSHIKTDVLTKDLKSWVDNEREFLRNKVEKFSLDDDVADFETYHPYEKIVQILNAWKSKYPENVKTQVIGQTYEKRSIYAVTLTEGIKSVGNKKNIVFFECGIHAREWVSPASCIYWANTLLADKKHDASLLKKYDFHLVPVTNPDGYVHTWTSNRLWRRNRNPGFIAFGACNGVDGNRNFDSHHCETGGSKNPCIQTYCGRTPFSEPETSAIRDYVNTITKIQKIKAYFSIHSFSQFWVFPYGFTDTPSPKDEFYQQLSKIATEAIRQTHNETYAFGTIPKLLYKASGNSIDWIEENNLADVVFTIELRDKGQFGFILPAQFIKPTAEEVWNGIKTVIA